MRTRLAEFGVLVELGKELISLHQVDDHVKGLVKDNLSGAEELIYAEYLVGADGARGTYLSTGNSTRKYDYVLFLHPLRLFPQGRLESCLG